MADPLRRLRGAPVRLLALGGVCSLILFGSVLSDLSGSNVWFFALAVAGVIALTTGLWLAQDWARRAAGVLTALMACWTALTGAPDALVVAAGLGCLAWMAFRPQTRRLFLDARRGLTSES